MSSKFGYPNAEALHRYIASLEFAVAKPNKRARKCKSSASPCSSGTTDIIITPVDGTDTLGKVSNDTHVTLPSYSHGYIIARLDNVGDGDDYWLGLEAGHTGYWLIDQKQGAEPVSHFVEVYQDAGGNWQASELKLDPPQTIYFGGCRKHDKHYPLEADFANCDLAPHFGTVHSRTYTTQDVKSTWISCVAGCCTTDGAQTVKDTTKASRADRPKRPSSSGAAKRPDA